MSDSDSIDAIGVDGGGTSCRIALSLGGRVTRVTAAQSNVTTDFEAAIRTISGGLHEVAEKAGVSMETLAGLPAYLGLAGVLDAETGARVGRRLELPRAQVEDDRISTLTGALSGANGVVAGIGTGSFLARRSGEQVQLIGGYGFRVGDNAAGAWLGRELLKRCLLALDGIAPGSALCDAVLAEYGGRASRVVDFASGAEPKDFATFAPRVFQAARDGDATGLALVRLGADYIAAGAKALGWVPGEVMCLTGGVGPHYAPYLPTEMAAALLEAKGTGLDGALLLAQRMARSADAERT